MTFVPLVGTLAYIYDRQAEQVLLIRRDARPDDDHFGKVNGLGGKLEIGEHVYAGLRREINEEAGIEIVSSSLRGTIAWIDFGPKREQWLGFIFLVDEWDGDFRTENEEGSLEWVSLTRLLDACHHDDLIRAQANLPIWEGDRHFIPLIFDDDPRCFHGAMPYDGNDFKGWSYERN
jgi:8-oxo-dGTP diphosphatase